MGHPLRYIDGPTMVEVTTRTVESRFLLTPDGRANELLLGVLGKGLRDHSEIQLHGYVFLSNHYHLLLTTPNAPTLSRFMRFLNSNVAREINRLRGRSGPLWHRRYRAIPVLDDASAVRRLEYLLSHGVKEHLVAAPEEWPGVRGVTTLLTGVASRGRWYDRSAMFHARRRGDRSLEQEHSKEYEVALAPLPCWAAEDQEERGPRVREIVRRIVSRGRKRARESGLPPPGAEAIRAQSPDFRPPRTKRSPAPFVHAASKELAARFREAYADFVRSFRAAAGRLADYAGPAGLPPGGAAVVVDLAGSATSVEGLSLCPAT